MKQRAFALCAALALLGCGLLALRVVTRRPGPAAPASSLPSQKVEFATTLAFFGSSEDPFFEASREALAEYAKEAGWALVTYDCKGDAQVQEAQVDDLLRDRGAHWAVLSPVGDQAGRCVDRLTGAGAKVVAMGAQGLDDWGQACTVALGPNQPYAAMGTYFGSGKSVALVADLPDDPQVEAVRLGLERAGVRVLDYGACWGVADYARDYVETVLARSPNLGGVVAFTAQGAMGAKEALGQRGTVLCLDSGSEAQWALALGQLDAVVEWDAQEAARQLVRALDALAKGQIPHIEPLGVHISTAET